MTPEGNQVLLSVGLSDRIMISILSGSIGDFLLFIFVTKSTLQLCEYCEERSQPICRETLPKISSRSMFTGFSPLTVMLQKGSVYVLPENYLKRVQRFKKLLPCNTLKRCHFQPITLINAFLMLSRKPFSWTANLWQMDINYKQFGRIIQKSKRRNTVVRIHLVILKVKLLFDSFK